MNLLALETATEACSVALVHGETLIARTELAPRRHAERVLPLAAIGPAVRKLLGLKPLTDVVDAQAEA